MIAVKHAAALRRELAAADHIPAALEELLAVNPQLWREEFSGIEKYLAEFGDRVPQSLKSELKNALARVHSSQV